MPRSRCRKDSSFETSVTKSVFLYGRPNKDKLALLKRMQATFTALVNEDIRILSTRNDLMMQLVKNDKKDSTMRTLEKTIRKKGLSSAFSQNAFDMAVTHLSHRLDEIRLDLLAEGMDPFARSKVLVCHVDHAKVQNGDDLCHGRSGKEFLSRLCKETSRYDGRGI